MSATQRRRLQPLCAVDGVSAAELDEQSADVQRVLAIRRRRATVLAQLQASHAQRSRPLPLWLSLIVIAFILWGMEALSQRLWGLEDTQIAVEPHQFR
jgi:hypothetical protein